MLFAFILMQRFGLSANLMSLAGLAIGIGMMVDGAVVMVENAFRLLSHARQSGRPINRTHVVLEAAREVANPIAFAILIIIVVFLPLFSLTGLEGKLFKPMALTITFAMAGLAAALAHTGAGAGRADPEAQGGEGHLAGPRGQAALPAAARLGARSQEDRRGQRRRRFCWPHSRSVPVSRQGVHAARCRKARSCSGSSASRRLRSKSRSASPTSWTQKLHEQYPQVRSVLATIGRAEKGETADVNYMEVLLDLKPQEEWPTEAVVRRARQGDAGVPRGRGADGGVRRDPADPDARRGTDLRRPSDARAQGLRPRPRAAR